jgi:hypothetical protein
MKRFFLLAVLISAVFGVSVTAVQAQSLDPGCSSEMWGYLQDQADATRARNRAYERELLHRQQSTLYLTCFDQAMAVSAKLGAIFSDPVPGSIPPANTLAFTDGASGQPVPGAQTPGTVAYPDAGVLEPTLAMDLGTVVNPEFDNWLSASAPQPAPAAGASNPTMFNFLPPWDPTKNQLTILDTALAAIETALKLAFTTAQATEEGTYTGLVMQINTLVQSMPTTQIEALPGDLTTYSQDIAQLTAAATAISTALAGGDSGVASLTGLTQAFTLNCTRVDDLWDTVDPTYDPTKPGVFYPPEGQFFNFSPYYPLKDFLGAPGTTTAQAGSSPGATPDFLQELGNTTDSAILKQALNDIGSAKGDTQSILNDNSKSPLGKAGNSPVWPAPPAFPAPSDGTPPTAQTVINAM